MDYGFQCTGSEQELLDCELVNGNCRLPADGSINGDDFEQFVFVRCGASTVSNC